MTGREPDAAADRPASAPPASAPPPLPAPGSAEATAMAPLCSVFRRYLKSANLKYTPERADVLDAIIAMDSVFEVEQLLEVMRGRGGRVSKATVYRTIKLLQDAGIITQALFDPRQSHYQLIYGRAPRDYMVCMKSGRTIEVTDPDLRAISQRLCDEHGWELVGHRFQIYAISPDATDTDEVQSSMSS